MYHVKLDNGYRYKFHGLEAAREFAKNRATINKNIATITGPDGVVIERIKPEHN